MFLRVLVVSGCLISATATAQPSAARTAVVTEQGPVPNEAPGGSAPATTVTSSPAQSTHVMPPPDDARSNPAEQREPGQVEPSEAGAAGREQASAPGATAAVANSGTVGASSSTAAAQAQPVNAAQAAPAAIDTHQRVSEDPLFVPAVVTIGAGSVALLASLVTGIGAHGAYNALERQCDHDICPSSVQGKLDSGKTLAVVSTVLTGVGIAGVGVGAALLVIALNRRSQDSTEHARWQWRPGPTPLGIGAGIAF